MPRFPARTLIAASAASCIGLAGLAGPAAAQAPSPVDELSAAIEDKVIGWRRDIHQNPELGNRETRTAGLVAAHLKALGYQVTEGVGATGVVAVLQGGLPGPVVALRADMDALPVEEKVDLPFASKVRAEWNGEEVGVMHACGHDAHTAILMGAAEVLAGMQDTLPGVVKLIFQPAEEGTPPGETGGARRMLAEGAFDDPKPDVIFGLHVMTAMNTGAIGYRSGPILASSDTFDLTVTGKQTHGAIPWAGIDPIVIGSQIVLGFQTIPSRQLDVTNQPAVVTVGTFRAGTRYNIVPGEAEMTGTVRTYDEDMRAFIKQRMQETASLIAQSGGGTAELTFREDGYATTINDPELTEMMIPSLEKVTGATVAMVPKATPSEDFSFFAQQVPGLFVLIGATPPGDDPKTAAPNHSPNFMLDEGSLLIGVRTLVNLTSGLHGDAAVAIAAFRRSGSATTAQPPRSAISRISLRRTAWAKLSPPSAVTTKAPGPPMICSSYSASRFSARGRPEHGGRQRIASPLMTTPAPSTASRAWAIVGPCGFHELSPERSITLRQPSKRFSSIRSSPFNSAAPIAFVPRARRGAAISRSPNARADASSATTVQSTTTSCAATPAHST